MTPAHIGKYRIDGVLGQGAMGIVYRGFDPSVGRAVAIKTVRKELLDGQQPWDAVARFRSEARAAGRLSHPNIVTVYEFAEDEHSAHLVCEYVPGTGLDTWLTRHGTPDLATALCWMGQLLDALACAHAHGVVHRDVKAANLLVVSQRLVKLTDFGIARVADANQTQVGLMIGTPSCMAPEQIVGGDIDGRTDVFAAGVLLYQLLTGQRPFTGSSEAVMQQILSQEVEAPSRRCAGLPAALDAAVLRALAKQPEHRHASAADFHLALRQAVPGNTAPTAADDEATRLIANPMAPAATRWDRPTERAWNPALLKQVEATLRSHVGPIAGLLVKKHARLTQTFDELLLQLARNIPAEAERERFIAAARAAQPHEAASGASLTPAPPPSASTPAPGSRAPAAPLDDATLATVRTRLAQHVGPMASIAVRRAAREATSLDDLCRRVADNVPDLRARQRFLEECGVAPTGRGPGG